MCLFLSPSLSLSLTDRLIPVYGVVAIVLILVLAIGVASVLLLVACVQTRRLGRKPDTNSINSFPVRLYTYLMHWTIKIFVGYKIFETFARFLKNFLQKSILYCTTKQAKKLRIFLKFVAKIILKNL